MMACTHDHSGTSASPNSSEEVESHHGTPATKLSPFSPDHVAEEPKHVNQGIVRTRVPPPFVLTRDRSNLGLNNKSANPIVSGSQDPFLSAPNLNPNTQSSGDGSKLSPNASTFTPTSLIESTSSNGNSSSSALQKPHSSPACVVGRQGLGPLSPTSHTGIAHYGLSGKRFFSSGPNTPFHTVSTDKEFISLGQFSTDVPKSRSLMAGPVHRTTSAKEIEKLLGVRVLRNPRIVR